MATYDMANKLPALDDDGDVGVEREHVVTRDGQRDLKFRGTLLASAAPKFHGQERWREYRIYRTAGGKYVFSKVGRSLLPDEVDKFSAEVFEPQGSYMSYEDKLQFFFGLDPLAKALYAKLEIDTSEKID